MLYWQCIYYFRSSCNNDMYVYCLLQIENEYGAQSKLLGSVGYNYISWAANMAVGLGTGVPWVMCKEEDAPDPVVSILIFPVLQILY